MGAQRKLEEEQGAAMTNEDYVQKWKDEEHNKCKPEANNAVKLYLEADPTKTMDDESTKNEFKKAFASCLAPTCEKLIEDKFGDNAKFLQIDDECKQKAMEGAMVAALGEGGSQEGGSQVQPAQIPLNEWTIGPVFAMVSSGSPSAFLSIGCKDCVSSFTVRTRAAKSTRRCEYRWRRFLN